MEEITDTTHKSVPKKKKYEWCRIICELDPYTTERSLVMKVLKNVGDGKEPSIYKFMLNSSPYLKLANEFLEDIINGNEIEEEKNLTAEEISMMYILKGRK